MNGLKTVSSGIDMKFDFYVGPPFKPTLAHMAVCWMLQRRKIPAHGGWVFNQFSGWWLYRPNTEGKRPAQGTDAGPV